MKSRTKKLTVHQDIFYDVVLRQAGTLSKGLLEAVMNTVDAQATTCSIGLTNTQAVIVDDGRGFQNETEIESWFEQLGKAHTKEELARKTYAQFRMGRAQLMAYGVNKWKTESYRMEVDIKSRGADYDLTVDAKPVPGCTIVVDFYDKLSPSAMHDTLEDIRLWCKYMPIDIYLNDEYITVDPEDEKWDHVTEEGYIRLRHHGNLLVYNLGAFVMEFPHYRLGTGGVLVSKQQVKVNFARNDIQSDCPVWKKLRPFINQQATKRNVSKKSLDDESRRRLATQVKTGELGWDDACELNLITAVTGRHYNLDYLLHPCGFSCLSVAPKGNPLGDNLMKSKAAFIVAEETLHRFGVKTLDGLVKTVEKISGRPSCCKTVDFAKLTEGMSDHSFILSEDNLSRNEKIWLAILRKAGPCVFVDGRQHAIGRNARRIVIGDSVCNNGWTDGRTYIAISKRYLARRSFDLCGFINVCRLLIHEVCHEEATTAEHDHTQEFYERFHDSVRDSLAGVVETMICSAPQVFKQYEKKETKALLSSRDRLHRLEEVEKGLRQAVQAAEKSIPE